MEAFNDTQFMVSFLFLFALSTTSSLLVKAQGDSEPVLDDSGNPILRGVNYVILPVGGGNGGGLHVTNAWKETSPRYVGPHTDESALGSSVQFSPAVNPKDNTIKLSTDMNVKFTSISLSGSSTVWRVNRNADQQTMFVTVGGVEGNPGRETFDNWFKIDKYEDAYKFNYCPAVCSYCQTICGDVGILTESDGGRKLLFISRGIYPLKVKFHKVY
ncbi:kunitz trypsin inhibitor 5-like [Capsicum chacoense]